MRNNERGNDTPFKSDEEWFLHSCYALLCYPCVTIVYVCEDFAFSAYVAHAMEDILTPLGIALTSAWEVVLHNECALGCGVLTDCEDLLEFTHDLLLERIEDVHDLHAQEEGRERSEEDSDIATTTFLEGEDAYQCAEHKDVG